MAKRKMPDLGELVICRISRINPHSAFAALEEYDSEGMIHISEVSRGWVKDIRKFVKPNSTVVAKVINIDESGRLSLSLKRVSKNEENKKIKSRQLEKRAERMLEVTGKGMNKSLEEAYKEAGNRLLETCGSLYEGFLAILQKPDSVRKALPESWFAALKEIAEKNIEQKDFQFRANLTIKTFKPDGINIIKGILSEAERMSLKVHYIAAPSYLVRYSSKTAKKGEKDFLEKLGRLAGRKEAEVSFVME